MRKLKFTTYHVGEGGVFWPQEIPGPSDFADCMCWKVYSYAMCVLKAASKARLDRYYEKISELAEVVGEKHWGHCM
eukprot:4532235-Amphidinium_carterae.1